MKQKKTTNLAKRIHMYNSLEDMEKQFAHDVAILGKEFTAIAEKNVDLLNPWDQTVMVAILTNMLACVEVQAEMDDVNMEKVMKDFYEIHLKDYRKQAKENLMKVRK